MWTETDPMKVVRNTRTLSAYRARQAAAQRAGMPFLLLPALLNPAILLPSLRLFARAPRHLPGWAFPTVGVIWLALMCASLAYGVHRRRCYLREHPLTGELAGVGWSRS